MGTEVLRQVLGGTLIDPHGAVCGPVPSVKQSSGSSRSSASSGIFLRISSGSGQSTVLPSEELVSSTPCRAEAWGSERGSLKKPGHLYVATALLVCWDPCRAG